MTTEDSTRFPFGDNWQSYARTLDPQRIAFAEQSLRRLLDGQRLDGRSFLDIGSGSGVHSLAALRLGAARVEAVDLDPRSVATTRSVLEAAAEGAPWRCRERSVFDLDPDDPGRFDVVYSWGVLHHTGEMWRAIDRAASLVAPGGELIIAIYLKTRLCDLWRWEKRWYTRLPWLQWAVLWPFTALRLARTAIALRRGPLRVLRDYRQQRGMSFHHDSHDWLGGYPYESATPAEVEDALAARGFRLVRSFGTRTPIGLFGSTCAEYVFRAETPAELSP